MVLKEHLVNKKILFLSVRTFNLEVEIKNKLEELGSEVTYYDERPANNNFIKGIIRLRRSLVQKRIDDYYKKILLDEAKIQFDYLFVNRGEIVPAFFLEELKKTQTNCQFIFYTWDSFANHAHPITILKYFDRKFTFDPQDAFLYKINFRPLFFLDAYKNLTHIPTKFDILFLGTAHSDRYKISSLIKKWALNNNLTCFCYYYMHGRLVYFFKKIFDKTFKEFKYSQLSFKSLKVKQIVELYQQSNIILDINHPFQKGLTMRTFEAIGAKRKLITTNKEIAKYPFYNENDFLIIDRNDIKLNLDFFKDNYQTLDSKLYEKFSLEGWLFNIFVDAEESFWNKCI
ncbi:MAG: hypothetical protein K9I82_11730 [Chitinophagaceae bacterium]|nr:hypothetical protein [Chitinophagaceae bacterium]